MGLSNITDLRDQYRNTKANEKTAELTKQLLSVAGDILTELRTANQQLAYLTELARYPLMQAPPQPEYTAYPAPPVPPSGAYRTGEIINGKRMTAAGNWEEVTEYKLGDSENGYRLTSGGWVPG